MEDFDMTAACDSFSSYVDAQDARAKAEYDGFDLVRPGHWEGAFDLPNGKLAGLTVKLGMGAYVEFEREDGSSVEIPVEGAGSPEDTDRIIDWALNNPEQFVANEVEGRLAGEE